MSYFHYSGKIANISCEGTFNVELFLFQGENKKKKHLNKNQANKQQENLSFCKAVLALVAVVRPSHHFCISDATAL